MCPVDNLNPAQMAEPPDGASIDTALLGKLRNCGADVDLPLSLPPETYTSNHIARAERDVIFRSGWIGVGRETLVANPGDYITLDIAGYSIILTRDRDGVLRAFANTCRHRGARLLDGTGVCKGIRCPFHSWFYGLDGQLVSAPQMDRVPGFDRSDYGLVNYQTAERAGFAFLSLAPNPPDIDRWLGEFTAFHREWPLAGLVSVRRRELTVACNWKLFLEVFNKYYHLPFVHPNSIDSLYAAPDPPDHVKGAFASQFGRTDGTAGLLEGNQEKALPPMVGLTGLAELGTRYSWVFPNMTFAANTDALWCYEAYPLGADSCHVVQTACFAPEVVEDPRHREQIQAYLGRLDAALDEDIPALLNQQRGLSSPDARQGPFQPDLEPNVASFARWYAGHWI